MEDFGAQTAEPVGLGGVVTGARNSTAEGGMVMGGVGGHTWANGRGTMGAADGSSDIAALHDALEAMKGPTSDFEIKRTKTPVDNDSVGLERFSSRSNDVDAELARLTEQVKKMVASNEAVCFLGFSR
jgi:hypothetical protein